METFVLGSMAALAAWKLANLGQQRDAYRARPIKSNEVSDGRVNEYVRDDYGDTLRLYNEYYTEEQLLKMGQPLGDYDYYHGPNPETEEEFYDPLTWANATVPTPHVRPHYEL